MTTCSIPDQNGNVYCTDNNTHRFINMTAAMGRNDNPQEILYILELTHFLPINPNMQCTNYITFNPQNYIIPDAVTGQDMTLTDFFYLYSQSNNFNDYSYYYNYTGTTNLNGCLNTTSCGMSNFEMVIGGDGVYPNGDQIPTREQPIGTLVDGSVYTTDTVFWQYILFDSTTVRPWLMNNFYFYTNTDNIDFPQGNQSCIDLCGTNNYINFNITVRLAILFDMQKYKEWVTSQNPAAPIISPFTVLHDSKNKPIDQQHKFKPIIIQPQKQNKFFILPGKQGQNKWWYILLFVIFVIVLILLVLLLVKMDDINKKKA